MIRLNRTRPYHLFIDLAHVHSETVLLYMYLVHVHCTSISGVDNVITSMHHNWAKILHVYNLYKLMAILKVIYKSRMKNLIS